MRRRKRKRLLFASLASLALILIASFGTIPKSVAISPGSAEFGYSGYDPATLSVYFPHTTLITTNVSNNGGYYTYAVSTGSPTSSITYNFNASDVYTVLLDVEYAASFSGNITYQFSGPVLLPISRTFQFYNQTTMSLSFLVELVNYNAPPDPQQIAQATAGYLISRLNTAIALLNNTQFSFQQLAEGQIMNIAYGEVASLLLSAIAVAVVVFYMRRVSGELRDIRREEGSE